MLTRLVIIFVVILAYKFLSNITCYFRCKKLQQTFVDWLADRSASCSQHRSEVISLFKRARVKDSYIPITQPTGFFQLASFNASVFQSFPSDIEVFANATYRKFQEAIGFYKFEALNTFNPLSWIDSILFLPKNLLLYIGLREEKTSFRLSNVLLTCLWWCILWAIALFDAEFKTFLITLLGKLQDVLR